MKAYDANGNPIVGDPANDPPEPQECKDRHAKQCEKRDDR